MVKRRSQRLGAGDELVLTVPAVVDPEDPPEPQDLHLTWLRDDDAFVVVNKPAGMAVHPAPGTPDGTVVNALLFQFPDLPGIGGERRPGIVHRLDKDTTGAMVVAKTDVALANLQDQFRARTVDKVYLALGHGNSKIDSGVIEGHLARHAKDRLRYTGRDVANRPDARTARTRWLVKKRFEGATLFEVRLDTGRTHQIRVHLAELGFPILRDTLYGSTRRDQKSPAPGVRKAAALLGHQALHASHLAFDHPTTGERVEVEAPLPPEFEAALAALKPL